MLISTAARERRSYWVAEIVRLSGDFGVDSSRVEEELRQEISTGGTQAVLDHLRLCGAIPEAYGVDTSEEKLYSKYTDSLLAATFRHVGLRSIVLSERVDAADVEAFATGYSFVADAKAFRLSRTAKNQKDFKIQALDGWRRDKPYATVICPLYQLPTRPSQIYQQAIARNVCILSYSHLAVLVRYSEIVPDGAPDLLRTCLDSVSILNPNKDAVAYWTSINRAFLNFDVQVAELWRAEKLATIEAIGIAKEESLTYLARLREEIANLSHEEAIARLVTSNRIESRSATIRSISDNGLMAFQ